MHALLGKSLAGRLDSDLIIVIFRTPVSFVIDLLQSFTSKSLTDCRVHILCVCRVCSDGGRRVRRK